MKNNSEDSRLSRMLQKDTKNTKQEKRKFIQKCYLLKLTVFYSELTGHQEEVKQHQNTFDQSLTELRKIEADIEEKRVTDAEATQSFNDSQKDHFELQSKIARLEQSIEYEKELQSQKSVNVKEIQKELQRINKEYEEDSVQIGQISSSLSKLDQTITKDKLCC